MLYVNSTIILYHTVPKVTDYHWFEADFGPGDFVAIFQRPQKVNLLAVIKLIQI